MNQPYKSIARLSLFISVIYSSSILMDRWTARMISLSVLSAMVPEASFYSARPNAREKIT